MITGGGRGLGRAIALAYAAEGADLVIAARTPVEIERVCHEASALGARAIPLSTDLTSSDDIESMMRRAVAEFGQLDVLVNNAGIGQGLAERPIRTLLDVDDRSWDVMFEVNTKASFLTMRSAIPQMIGQGGGSIINVSSRLSYRPVPGNIPYGPTKAALDQLTRCAAVEFAEAGVRCNLLHPGGPIDTSIFTANYQPPSRAELQPPDIIGPAAVWLGSDESSSVNGQTINCREWNASRGITF